MLKSILSIFVLITTTKSSQIDKRNNFCEILDEVNLGQVDRKFALKGFNISIGVLSHAVNQKTGKLDQDYISIRMFDEVARRAQFNYKDNFQVYDHPTGNGTYTDVLLSMLDNNDVGVEWWVRNIDRASAGITGPKGWYDASTVIIKRDETSADVKFNLFSVFSPFTNDVWMVLIFTVLISGVIYHLVDKVTCRTRDRLGDNLFMSVMAFTGNPDALAHTIPSRTILISMSLLSIVIVAAYTANLASFLILNNKIAIKTFQNVVNNNYRVCAIKAWPDVQTIMKKYERGIYIDKVDELGVYRGLANNECEVGLMSLESHNLYRNSLKYNPNCNLEIAGWPVLVSEASFALKSYAGNCVSIVRDVLDLNLLEMARDSTIDRIKNEQYTGEQECSVNSGDESNEQLSLKHFGGALVIYYFIILSVSVYAILCVKYPRTFRLKLHQLSCMNQASAWLRLQAPHYFSGSRERHLNEEKLQDSDIDDDEDDDCSEPSSNEISKIFPAFARLTPKDRAVKELYIEVLKIRTTQVDMQSTVQCNQTELKNETQKLNESVEKVNESLEKVNESIERLKTESLQNNNA